MGKPVSSSTVLKVVEATADAPFERGQMLVSGDAPWSRFVKLPVGGGASSIVGPSVRPIPFDTGKHSPSLALGALGMPGLTAYFGMLHEGLRAPTNSSSTTSQTVLVSGDI